MPKSRKQKPKQELFLTPEEVAAMREQAAITLGYKNWDALWADMVDEDGEDAGLNIGNLNCDPSQFERVFIDYPLPATDSFTIPTMPATVIVPYCDYMDTKVLAVHNLETLGHISHDSADVNVYRKIDTDEKAYVLMAQGEEGLNMYSV